MTTWTILGVLDATRTWFTQKGIEGARLDAEILIAHALGLSRVMLYARFDQVLDDEQLAQIRALVARRGKHEPVAYITGQREFWSLGLSVDPRVLVPRPDTEVLIEVVLARLSGTRVVDVGTGSGAIALAVAHERKDADVLAVDVSEDALTVARANAAKVGLGERVRFLHSDLLASCEETFDAIVANLPYIRAADIGGLTPDVRDFEPRLALDGGADGLDLIRRLITDARAHLVPGGLLALEAGFDQLDQVASLLRDGGYEAVEVRSDYGGNPRVASATLPR